MPSPYQWLAIAALLPSVSGASAPKTTASQVSNIGTTGKQGEVLFAARTVVRRALPASNESACRKVVQEFYHWYVPRMMREVRISARDQALITRPRNFSLELRRRLTEDGAAAAKSPDEIVGLDFDPFTNSQDPASRYVAKRVYRSGKGYRVEVHGIINGKPNEAPDVIPELVQSRGRWMFVNFHYPAEGKEPKSDLLGVLKELRDARRKPARRSPAPR
jgi:hypothetical protein